ncbi:MAG: hypothetical protein QOE38_648, partial [Thermoleophilaceae bacterium]|nr:hypothetical protein [Thermoleophilaceae bacterium]
MSNRLLNAAIAVALVALAFVSFALPASAEQRTLRVRLATGSIITVTVDAPCVPMDQVPGLPGTPVEDLTPSSVCPPAAPDTPAQPQQPATPPQQGGNDGGRPQSGGGSGGSKQPSSSPSTHNGHKQGRTRSHSHAAPNSDPQAQAK